MKTLFSCQPSLQQPSFFGQLYTKVRQWSSGKHASGQKRHERGRQKIQTKSGWHWTIQHFTSSLFNKTLTLIQTNENSPNDHPDAAAARLCGQKRHAKYARSVHIEKCVRDVVAATTHGFLIDSISQNVQHEHPDRMERSHCGQKRHTRYPLTVQNNIRSGWFSSKNS